MDFLKEFGSSIGQKEISIENEKGKKINVPVVFKIGDVRNFMIELTTEDNKKNPVDIQTDFAVKVISQGSPELDKKDITLFIEMNFKKVTEAISHLLSGDKKEIDEYNQLKN